MVRRLDKQFKISAIILILDVRFSVKEVTQEPDIHSSILVFSLLEGNNNCKMIIRVFFYLYIYKS